MIVSAHQPNFAPWLGFFDKMRRSDVLVLLDTVQFIKRGYQNRTRMKGIGGPQWLTVPVITKGRYDQVTRDVEIDESRDWRAFIRGRSGASWRRRPEGRALSSSSSRSTPTRSPPASSSSTSRCSARVVLRLGIATRLVMASDLEPLAVRPG